jgi:hypothetical protein
MPGQGLKALETLGMDNEQAPTALDSEAVPLPHSWEAAAAGGLLVSMRLSAPAISSRGDAALPLSSVAA